MGGFFDVFLWFLKVVCGFFADFGGFYYGDNYFNIDIDDC
jgi:hypothetical protein